MNLERNLEKNLEILPYLENYKSIPGVYDELVDDFRNIREKYISLMKSFYDLGWEELDKRSKDADRILQENGVTYNIYSEGNKTERAWKLDLFPIVIESEEWRKIERGLEQRGELLDSILKDLYGQRRVIKEKRIPAELIWNCPGFLRPCDGMFANSRLSFFAVDMIRSKDGSFVILSNRVQAPSGSGYSLENRIVISRVFPSIYRDSQVHRIASYFRSLRKNLQDFSAVEGRDPIIALLTPGPGSETYFEHSYLASYLGYTLVQGADLTVRSNTVYMKTVEGLQKVDLILKRVDDFYMDALELKGDSLLGVPGLLEAVRSKAVKVANPIGAGILENRAILCYMNELCRFYLGEELILPNVTTFWLGSQENYAYVIKDADDFIFKPVYPTSQDHSYLPKYMNDQDKQNLWVKIRQNPGLWVAQEVVESSTAPVIQNQGFSPGRSIYRTFVTSSSSGYQVMSGGLVRVTTNPEEIFITNQRGAFSKDLWILSTESQREEAIQISPAERVFLSRQAFGVPSRVADNLFWFARYAERAEGIARLLRESINSILEFNENSDTVAQEISLKLLSFVTYTYPGFLGDDSKELIQNPYPEVYRLLYDSTVPGSVAFNLQALSQSAKNVRDRLSDDTRKIIKNLEMIRSSTPKTYDLILEDIFQILILLTSLTGLSFENLSRETGWYFLDMGRRIERILMLIRLFQGLLEMGRYQNRNILSSLLNINDIRITYRRRYRYKVDVDSVFDILLFDEKNPRSLGFQINELNQNIQKLPGKEIGKTYPEDRDTLLLFTTYKMKDISILTKEGILDQDLTLSWIHEIAEKTKSLSETITERYFSYAEKQVVFGG